MRHAPLFHRAEVLSRFRLATAALAGTLAALLTTACGDTARLSVSEGMGPNPTLPQPRPSLIPTAKVAEAIGWPAGQGPQAGAGMAVTPYATGLNHPRWLYTLPNGDVLVAESNAPRRREARGPRAWVMSLMMKRAGAGAVSPDRITLLRDADGDGQAEQRSVFLEGLHSPFGMSLIEERLYIANTDAVLSLPYRSGDLQARGTLTKVMDLPAGLINHHWTKNLLASPDGSRLYVSVGSNSNVAENGMQAERGRAAIHEYEFASGRSRVFASGLRNPNGMAWVGEGPTPRLWTVVNERDEIGSDLVPDYLSSVQDGDFFGWPYSYYGQHVDERVEPPRPDEVQRARKPDYALGPHTASLGLQWLAASPLRDQFGPGMVVAQHGSWNREPPSGYQVLFVPFQNGHPVGMPIPWVTGFLDQQGRAQGRPVGLAQDRLGALLVADDVGNAVWRLQQVPASAR